MGRDGSGCGMSIRDLVLLYTTSWPQPPKCQEKKLEHLGPVPEFSTALSFSNVWEAMSTEAMKPCGQAGAQT